MAKKLFDILWSQIRNRIQFCWTSYNIVFLSLAEERKSHAHFIFQRDWQLINAMRCSYILHRSSMTVEWNLVIFAILDISRKCHVITPLNVDSDVSNLCWCHYPLDNMQTLLEVHASPHLRVPRVSDQKSLANEDGLFGRDSKLVLSARLHHKDYFISRQTHAPMPKFYSLPEQTEQLPCLLAIHLNWPWLYYDESTPQLIFKGGPYHLIGWT